MPADQCLSPVELRNFVLGQTDDDRSEEILVHLAECPACEDTVASLDDTADSLVVSVRQAVEPDDVEAEGASDPLAAALASVRSRFAPSVSEPPVDESMSRIIERVRDYELVDELGSGGMGTVYKAVHTKLDRTVALKLLPARRLRDRGAVSRFEREMKAIGRLDHPAIVRATDAGEVDGTHFLAMDFVDGIDLGKLVRLIGPLDVASACELIRQAAIGLHYAHEQGLIHRDVKPSNLMVEKGRGPRVEGRELNSADRSESPSSLSALDSQSSSVRILDLGLALFGSASEAVDELTTVGQLMGTLDYMAPEQADNSHSVDARADVYSLGATLFKLLTGMAPYETTERCSPLQKMKALATTDPPAIASRREELPDSLAAIVDRTLLRDPDERFQSAAEVAEALMPFCEGHSINDLVECGLQLAEQQRDRDSSHRPALNGDLAAKPSLNGQPATRMLATDGSAPALQTDERRSPSKAKRLLRQLMWSAIMLLAGITIWIQTDTGTLKIECADDSIPIEIRNDAGEVVQKETLNVGPNDITIRSGSYEIILPKDYDELKVENGKYELTRGGEWIARISRSQLSTRQAAPTESPQSIEKTPETNSQMSKLALHFPSGGRGAPLPKGMAWGIFRISEARSYSDLSNGADRFDVYVISRDSDRDKEAGDYQLVTEMAQVRHFSWDLDDQLIVMLAVRDEDLERVKLAHRVGELILRLHDPNAPLADGALVSRFDEEAASRLVAERERLANAVYSGRTFQDWQQSVLTERNPEELKNAVMALCILGRQNRDREAAETVLKVTDAYPCEIGSSPEGQLVAASIRYLRTLDADAIVPALLEALKSRGTNTRRLIVEHLASGVMYGAGGNIGLPGAGTIPNTGKAEPLMSRLSKSREYRKTLVELFPEFNHDDPETSMLRHVAFQQIEGFLDDAALKPEIDALLEDIYRKRDTTRMSNATTGPFYLPRAILHLTRRNPKPELTTYYLDRIERSRLPAGDKNRYAWLHLQRDEWYGLWLLAGHADAAVDRIARLLNSKLPRTLGPSPLQIDTLPVDPTDWHNAEGTHQSVTRKLLVLDMLASVGPGAKSALPVVADEIERLTGQRPADDGEFGYEANDQRTVYEQYAASFSQILTGSNHGGGGFGGGSMGTGGGFFSVSDAAPDAVDRKPIVMPEPWLRLNAALRAFKAIAGQTPRFGEFPLTLKQSKGNAAGMMGAMSAGGGGYPGAGLPGGDMEAGSGYGAGAYEGEYGGAGDGMMGYGSSSSESHDWRPRLVTIRGKHFDEWVTADLAVETASELEDVRRAVELLGGNEEPAVVASFFGRVFAAAMKLRGKITETDRKVIHAAFRDCWLSKDGPARGELIKSIFSGTPVRIALVLTEIVTLSRDLTKEKPPLNVAWAEPNAITRELIFAIAFGSRYQSLVDNWDQHGPELRAAILHVETQLPALKQVNRTDLLQKLLEEGTPAEKLVAALIVARIDLSKQKDAPPRARNYDKRFAETPPLQPALKRSAIDALVHVIRERPKDLDWTNAVPALVSLSRGALSGELASELAELILADSAQADSIAPFSIRVNHPEDPFAAGVDAMYGEMGGGETMLGGVGGMGLPGASGIGGAMSEGLPGLGYPGGGDSGSGYPGGLPGMAGGYGSGMGYAVTLDPVVLTLSRRFLLCELLAIAPPSDEKLRDRIASQLAELLRKPGALDGVKEWASSTLDVVTGYWKRGATFRGTMKADPKTESQEFARAAIRAVAVLVPTERFGELLDLKKLMDLKPPAGGTPGGAFPNAPGAPAATYKGRTYAEWLVDVRRERSPEELTESLAALTALGAGTHDAEIAQEILGIVARLKITREDRKSPNGKLLDSTAHRINQLSTAAVVPLIAKAVRSGQPEVIWYVSEMLRPDISAREWNSILPQRNESVSIALYTSPEFRDALLSVWSKTPANIRPQFVVAACLFANLDVPDGELHDNELLKWLADVAGSDDVETLVPAGAVFDRSSLKLHACRALAQVFPDCPELPAWTMDGLEPFRQRDGNDWWYHTANGWVTLKLIGENAASEAGRLAGWIADTDEEHSSVIELVWTPATRTAEKEPGMLAIPRRLVMLEAFAAIHGSRKLSDPARKMLEPLRDVVPVFAAAALDDERSVARADGEYVTETELSALDTLISVTGGINSFRIGEFGSTGLKISSLDGAKLVIAHRRCQKLIRELLAEAAAEESQSEPD